MRKFWCIIKTGTDLDMETEVEAKNDNEAIKAILKQFYWYKDYGNMVRRNTVEILKNGKFKPLLV